MTRTAISSPPRGREGIGTIGGIGRIPYAPYAPYALASSSPRSRADQGSTSHAPFSGRLVSRQNEATGTRARELHAAAPRYVGGPVLADRPRRAPVGEGSRLDGPVGVVGIQVPEQLYNLTAVRIVGFTASTRSTGCQERQKRVTAPFGSLFKAAERDDYPAVSCNEGGHCSPAPALPERGQRLFLSFKAALGELKELPTPPARSRRVGRARGSHFEPESEHLGPSQRAARGLLWVATRQIVKEMN